VARQSDYPGVYPYQGPGGEALYYCRYPRSDGTWTTKRGFRSARAANGFRTAAVSDARRGEVATTPKDSFAVLFDRWLSRRRPYLSEGTHRDYEVHGRKRLKPALGAKRLSRIVVEDVEDLVEDLIDRELAPKTINNCLAVLGAFLNWCVQRDPPYLARNPAAAVESIRADHAEIDFLRGDEVRRYLAACAPVYRPLAIVLIGSGCRISEALGLEWDDLDGQSCSVRVLRQDRKGAEGRRGGARRRGAASPKGRRYRVVQVSPWVMQTLLDLRAAQSELAPVAGDAKVFARYRPAPAYAHALSPAARQRRARIAEDLTAVIEGRAAWTQAEIARRHGASQQLVSLVRTALLSESPRPITRDVVSRTWHHQALVGAAIVRPLRLHDLRHTAAVRWLQHGQALSFGQEQLGHRNVQTTIDHYAAYERGYVNERLAAMDAPLRDGLELECLNPCLTDAATNPVGAALAHQKTPPERGFPQCAEEDSNLHGP
jgi:integrase